MSLRYGRDALSALRCLASSLMACIANLDSVAPHAGVQLGLGEMGALLGLC